MKIIENDILFCLYQDSVEMLVQRIYDFFRKHSDILKSINGCNDSLKSLFLQNDFKLYPTKRKTIVFYDEKTKIFVKILYPFKFKEKLKARFTNQSKKVYFLSESLRKAGIKVPAVLAYGKIKKYNLPFFFMERISGSQLKKILIRQKSLLPMDTYFDIMKNVANLHKAGYWFRDLHLAHIYIEDSKMSGFIDFENVHKNIFFKIKKQAKDISGLNHPELQLSEEEKMRILKFYMAELKIKCETKFISYVKHYSETRWKKN